MLRLAAPAGTAQAPAGPLLGASRQSLTVYDASYVALAEALDVTLLTGDGRLARATGPRCRVEILRPASLSAASPSFDSSLQAEDQSGREVDERIEPLLTQSTTVECSIDQRDGRLGIVYFDHKLRVKLVAQRYQHGLFGIMHNPESPFALTPVGTYREESGKAVCQPWETGH